jgi:hypothetical protein
MIARVVGPVYKADDDFHCDTLLEIEAEPVCGEDFCDGCGDCLACQGHGIEDWCSGWGSSWVIYADEYVKDPESHRAMLPHLDAIRGALEEWRAARTQSR